MDSGEPARAGRRSPRPEQRQRDAGRSRERIVDAAVVEFGDKGFAGARVGEIAARAGVNVQLISYYFGGKAGLYRELAARWRLTTTELSSAGSLAEVVAGYARNALQNRDQTRLLLWDGLSPRGPGADEDADPAGDGAPDYLPAAVADLRARQRAGELPAELDPAQLLLALFAAAAAPVMLPRIAQRLGLDPSTVEFGQSYPELMAALVGLLSRSRPG